MNKALALVQRYHQAKQSVILSGYAREIFWQESICLDSLTEQDLLCETAWVILNSGMRESVIRGLFPLFSEAFRNWHSACDVVEHESSCRRRAVEVFGNRAKVNAIVDICWTVYEEGFQNLKKRIQKEGIPALRDLPFIGPVTGYHLAKNIGMDVVKPDRHLCRLSSALGFSSPSTMCEEISSFTEDRISVVDIVIWRYATLNRDYISHFSRASKRID